MNFPKKEKFLAFIKGKKIAFVFENPFEDWEMRFGAIRVEGIPDELAGIGEKDLLGQLESLADSGLVRKSVSESPFAKGWRAEVARLIALESEGKKVDTSEALQAASWYEQHPDIIFQC